MIMLSDALYWLNAQPGQHLDYDKEYGQQCVDFFNFYYQYITGENPLALGYAVPGAKDLWNVPDGRFQNIPDSSTLVPQPGDIAIYGAAWGAGYGHVECVVSHDDNGCTFVGENEHNDPTQGVVSVYRTWAEMRGLLGVKRPLWPTPPVVTPAPAPQPVAVVPSPPPPYIPPAAPTPVKKAETYTLLITLVYYSTQVDAQNDENAVGTIPEGTYYVWLKGGDSNIYYNLTTDNTKNQNKWINILNNKAPLNKPLVTQQPIPVIAKALLPSDVQPSGANDTAWRATYKQANANGSSDTYELLQDVKMVDYSGQRQYVILTKGTRVNVTGTFVKSGVTFYRVRANNDVAYAWWYGISLYNDDSQPNIKKQVSTVAEDEQRLSDIFYYLGQDIRKWMDIKIRKKGQ